MDECPLSEDRLANYIYIPMQDGTGEYWHMKNFDGMAPRKFAELLEMVEPFQPMTEGDLAAGGRRKDFKEEKQKLKLEREKAKTANIQGRADKKQAAVRYKDAKAQAAATGKGGNAGDTIKDIVGSVAGAAGKIFGKGGGEDAAAERVQIGTTLDVSGRNDPPLVEETFFEKNKTAILVVGGLVIVGGIAYFATRNK